MRHLKLIILTVFIFVNIFLPSKVSAQDSIKVATNNFIGDYRHMADFIIKNNIDIIGLQEFRDAPKMKSYLDSKGYPMDSMSIGYFGGTVTASIFFKRSFPAISWDQFTYQQDQQRPLQRLKVTTPIGDLTFINYHGGSDCNALNTAQNYINTFNEKNVIWVGDFNENYLYEGTIRNECGVALLANNNYSCYLKDPVACKNSSKNAGQLNVCDNSRNIVYDYLFLQKTSDYKITNSYVDVTLCDSDHYPVIATLTKKSAVYDVNKNGGIDISDVLYVIKLIFAQNTNAIIETYDFNLNGIVDIQDALTVLNKMFN